MNNSTRLIITTFSLISCLFSMNALADVDDASQPIVSGLANGLSDRTFSSPQGLGPYDVGRTTISYTDETREDRSIVIDVWYPIVSGAGLDPSVYDLVFAELPSVQAKAGGTIASGEFPLLVFSHGSQGIRFQSYFLTEHLASYGFVVAAPDHLGNTATDLVFGTTLPYFQNVVNRPLDISFTISRMLENDQTAGSIFYTAIDEDRIGLLGHSFGGYTTLAVASGTFTSPKDDRVDALAPFAPASSILNDFRLSSITQPTLILGGTADITTPIDDQSTRPFGLMTDAERFQIDLIDAGHQSFTNICVFSDTLLNVGIPPNLINFILGNAEQGCAPELIPIDRAQNITNLYMVSFFKNYLDVDSRFAFYLSPEFAIGKNLPVVIQFEEAD